MGAEPRTKEASGSKGRLVAIRTDQAVETSLWQTVHVVGPENGPSFAQFLGRARCDKSKNGVEDADIVFFTGGMVDVHPAMYGADLDLVHESVYWQDQWCVEVMLQYIETYKRCLELGIPMVGVCLGAQFLHVMNGGKVYQDIDNHNSDHALYINSTGETIENSSSVHHQAVVENDKMEVLAVTCESNERWLNANDYELVIDNPSSEDVEAFWYEDTLCLGFQGHPEYQSYPEYSEWCRKMICEYIIANEDHLEYRNNVLRKKPQLLLEQNLSLPQAIIDFEKEYS